MGMSAWAELHFGWDLGGPEGGWWVSDGPEPLDRWEPTWLDDLGVSLETFEEEPEDWVAQRLLRAVAGFTEPSPASAHEYPYPDELRAPWLAWINRRRAALEGTGVDLVSHGHHDVPGYLLGAREARREIQWGQVMRLGTAADAYDDRALAESLVVAEQRHGARWRRELWTAAAALDVAPRGEPQWLVVASYG